MTKLLLIALICLAAPSSFASKTSWGSSQKDSVVSLPETTGTTCKWAQNKVPSTACVYEEGCLTKDSIRQHQASLDEARKRM
jgi:hypothetical protein